MIEKMYAIRARYLYVLKSLLLTSWTIFCLISGHLIAEKREIALVFDDSGSMNGNPYYAVNYATQILVGLLNPEDSLHIIRMSTPGDAKKMPLYQKQSIMDEIRQWELGKHTPFLAVSTGMDLLEHAGSGDKWLIIFTDGKMDVDSEGKEKIKNFLTRSGAKSIILSINVEKNKLLDVFCAEGLVDVLRSPADFGKVFNAMEYIALSVMGMTQGGLDADFGTKAVTVNSVMPLKKLIILQQEADEGKKLASIENVFDSNNITVPVEGVFEASCANKIFGKISHVSYAAEGSRIIPAGKIRIMLNGDPGYGNFKIFPEVAVELSAKPSKDYERVDGNVYYVCNDKTHISIIAELRTPEGNLTSPEILKKTLVTVYYADKNDVMEFKDNCFIKTIPLESSKIPVSVSAKFPGYFNFKTNIFTLSKIPCKKPDILFVNKNISYPDIKVTDLAEAQYLMLDPEINGKKIDGEDFKKLKLNILQAPDIKIETLENGRGWKIRPRPSSIFPFKEKTGAYSLLLEISSFEKGTVPVRTQINFKILDVSFWEKYGKMILWALFLLFMQWYVLGLIKRPRFCKGGEIIYQRIAKYSKNREMSEGLKCSLWNRIFVPYAPETAKVFGMKFKAGKRRGYIELPKDVQTDRMYIAGNLLEEPRKKDQRISSGDELTVEYSSYKESYKYKTL